MKSKNKFSKFLSSCFTMKENADDLVTLCSPKHKEMRDKIISLPCAEQFVCRRVYLVTGRTFSGRLPDSSLHREQDCVDRVLNFISCKPFNFSVQIVVTTCSTQTLKAFDESFVDHI